MLRPALLTVLALLPSLAFADPKDDAGLSIDGRMSAVFATHTAGTTVFIETDLRIEVGFLSKALLQFREQVRVAPTAVEEGDLVPPVHGVLDGVGSDESRATEHQDLELLLRSNLSF